MVERLDAALDALEQMLEQQAQAVRTGDADALPAIAHSLNNRLAALRSSITRLPNEAQQARLRALHARVRANHEMVNRRQLDVQRALDALGSSSLLLQQAQARSTYAAAGRLSAAPVRGLAYAQA